MTEREKMLAGRLYDASDPELAAARRRCRDLLGRLNRSEDREEGLRRDVFEKLFGAHGDELWIEPPFYCDYGAHIELGNRVYFNFNCVVLDPARVVVGDDVLVGPAVQIYTATHPMSTRERRTRKESAMSVTIESDVWIGGGAVILPGVTIGRESVIGAGAVVTRDVPAGVFAAGNPCRTIREADR